MTNRIRVAVEAGKKGKKSAAFALDWPGWNRGGSSNEVAYANWAGYRHRYRPIAERAGLAAEFDAQPDSEIVVTYEGTGSTDFWGISFAASPFDIGPLPADVMERRLRLLWACWEFFDEVASRVSSDLKKGPRGGGRDRDAIINHTLGVERTTFAPSVGIEYPEGVILEPSVRRQYREDFADALRQYNAAGKQAGKNKKSEVSFLLRHTAYHTMDHAWEMEDKDLTGK